MPHTTTKTFAPNPIDPPADLAPAVLRVLRLLFELGQADESAHVGTLAARLGQAPATTARHLLDLEVAGYAHAERARLTMAGLVLATRLPAVARDSRSPSGSPGQAPRRARPPRQLPPGFLALRRSAPPSTRKDSHGRA